MPTPQLTAPQFTSRQPFQWISAVDSSLSIATTNPLQNNPVRVNVTTGSVAQVIQLINSTTAVAGFGEYPPFSISVEWDVMSFTDYERLAQVAQYPLTLITHRNVGYYGVFVLPNGPSIDKPRAKDVVKPTGTMYVLGPSDSGGASTVNRIDPSTCGLTCTNGAAGSGYIAASTQLWYYLTFSSKWGESTPFTLATTSASGGSTGNTLTWTWPTTTNYCDYATIYVANQNNPATAMKLGDILNGLTPTWLDLVGFNGAPFNIQPPSANNAFRGKWSGALWFNETP